MIATNKLINNPTFIIKKVIKNPKPTVTPNLLFSYESKSNSPKLAKKRFFKASLKV